LRPTFPRAGNYEIEKNRLLEAHEQERLDGGAAELQARILLP